MASFKTIAKMSIHSLLHWHWGLISHYSTIKRDMVLLSIWYCPKQRQSILLVKGRLLSSCQGSQAAKAAVEQLIAYMVHICTCCCLMSMLSFIPTFPSYAKFYSHLPQIEILIFPNWLPVGSLHWRMHKYRKQIVW